MGDVVTGDVVATAGGLVSGSRAGDGVLAFRGIPYAAPPFGPARLCTPQPAAAWDGVLAATGFGPIPPQRASLVPGMPAWSPEDGEEILTVNVWVPERRRTGLPVLVWIYGGAYTGGCANVYDPTVLVRAGLVVVTLNYRVGFEGFAHVPGAPDNRGLLDQVAALRWVQENIAGFGGDPANVTVAGESAGAGSVAALAVMPSASGLFRRGIAHSVPSEYFSAPEAAAIGARIAAAAGLAATRDELAAAPPQQLIRASAAVLAMFNADPQTGRRYYLPTIFNPVADGEVLPRAPLQAVEAGTAAETDLLFCHTVDEFRLFTATRMAPEVATEAQLAAVAGACGLSAGQLARYRSLVPRHSVPDVYAKIMTDFLFGEYTTRLAEAAARAGGRSYLARFAWRSRAFGGALGACHGADVPFCFGDLKRREEGGMGMGEMLLGGQASEQDWALSRRMVQAWARFAASGDPGWPAITPETTPVRIWDGTDTLSTDAGSGTRQVWAERSYPPAGT